MAVRKHIQAICHGPIAFGVQYKSPWEDVWLRWHGKPGRTRYYLGPTLCCEAELIADLEMNIECQRKHPEYDYSEDIDGSRRMLQDLRGSRFASELVGGTPGIYTKANGIDRKEAEAMLAFMLEKRFDIKNPKFDWRRQTDFCVSPMGFGHYES